MKEHSRFSATCDRRNDLDLRRLRKLEGDIDRAKSDLAGQSGSWRTPHRFAGVAMSLHLYMLASYAALGAVALRLIMP